MALQIHHHIKILIKDILLRFGEKEESHYPTVRMSDIANVSLNSDISSPLYSSTLNSKNGDITHITETERPNDNLHNMMNNMKTNTENLTKVNNNHNLKAKNNNDYTDYKHRQENKPLKLKVIITKPDQNGRVMNVLNDLSKVQSPIVEKNSVDYVTTVKEPRKNVPIMGRNALLKKANIDQHDSLIIYDLITEKYNGVINHYLDRSTQRRRLRTESSDTYSDTVYSSPAAYSPLSLSSISTPGSIGPDEKSGFRFPISGYTPMRSDFRVTASLDGVNKVLDESDEVEYSNDEGPHRKDFRFLVSTDETNKETTIEDMESSANITCATEKSSTSVSDYDPKKFLDDALGELTNLSIAYGISNESTDDKKGSAQQQDDGSIGTSNLSTLLSRASSLCISAASKRNTKKNSSTRSAAHLPDVLENKRLSFNTENLYLDHLMKTLSLQNEIMFQVSKALNYCRTTKKFDSSLELLEAERILLVASCTKEALIKEIQNAEDDTYEKHNDTKCCGEVTLSNLIFHLKDGLNKTDAHRDFAEHFLVIFICGSVVLASEIVTADEKGAVHIKRKFGFPNLAPDFEISVCIYAMRIGNKLQSHQDQKTTCPSPKKIFFHLKKCSKKYKVLNDVVYIKPSSFTLWGRYEIRSRDLSKTRNYAITLNMQNTPLSASLSGAFSVNINTDVKLTNKASGFLTIGTDNEHGCTIWNRRWCVLDGSTLKYWNYPSEEISSPLGTINLCSCLEQRVHLADRSICARPRTLMLPIRQKETEKKYLLSADSCSNMEEWEKEINDVLCSLRLWNSVEV